MTKEKRLLAVGDRVAVYGFCDSESCGYNGEIGEVAQLGVDQLAHEVYVRFQHKRGYYIFHQRQCRRLVRKPRRTCSLRFTKLNGWVIDSRPAEPWKEDEEIPFVERRRK